MFNSGLPGSLLYVYFPLPFLPLFSPFPDYLLIQSSSIDFSMFHYLDLLRLRQYDVYLFDSVSLSSLNGVQYKVYTVPRSPSWTPRTEFKIPRKDGSL